MMKRYRINKTTTFVEDNHSGNKEKYLIPGKIINGCIQSPNEQCVFYFRM